MLAVVFGILFSQVAVGTPAPVTDVRLLNPSQTSVLAEIDTGKAGGDPIGLAWNADGTIYLRVRQDKDKTRHYLIATQPAISFAQWDGVPAWAARYWEWKSGIVAPGDPSLKLEVEQRREATKTVNVPGGAILAGMSSLPVEGGEGLAQSVVIAAANATIMNGIVTVRFKGQVVGEWTNEVPQLGMRFGWGPAPMGVLAYVDGEGRLVLADREGRRLPVPGVSQALLPAWSVDGKQILYLQKKSRTLYLLAVTSIQ